MPSEAFPLRSVAGERSDFPKVPGAVFVTSFSKKYSAPRANCFSANFLSILLVRKVSILPTFGQSFPFFPGLKIISSLYGFSKHCPQCLVFIKKGIQTRKSVIDIGPGASQPKAGTQVPLGGSHITQRNPVMSREDLDSQVP